MMIKHDAITMTIGLFTGGLAYISVSEIMSIVFYCAGIFSIVVTTIISILKWKKNALTDGKISNEELDDLQNIVDTATNDIQNQSKGDDE